MNAQPLFRSLLLLGALGPGALLTAASGNQQGGTATNAPPSPPPPVAAAFAKSFKTSALVTGMPGSEHGLGTGSTLGMGKTLTSASQSTLTPFNSMAGAQMSLAVGPTSPVRFGLVAGAVNDGLGAPPFTPLYREGRVDVDTVLMLPGQTGTQWDITLSAIVQATWGAGIGCSQLQIDVGDDGVWEGTWGCLQPTLTQAFVGTATSNNGLPVRIRLIGETRSWTTSTPDHFLLNLTLDCTPATANDYSADYGVFDLESVATRRFGGKVSLAAAPERREEFSAAALRA